MMEKATPKPTQLADDISPDNALSGTPEQASQAASIMRKACEVEELWRHTPLNERISKVRQLLAKLATVDIVEELADDLNRTLASARSQLMSIEKKLAKPITLPGPTGESNKLYLEPRGILVCFADKEVTFEYWALSIVTALATGNCVVSVVSELFYEEALAVKDKFQAVGAPEAVFQVAKLGHLDALLMDEKLAGVVVDSNTERTAHITAMLAEREGAILPVITAEYNDKLIQRLMTEKTISTDTTASGGNTSLMTMVEEDE